VWRCHPNQLYAVEVTLPDSAAGVRQLEKRTMNILDLLPSVSCLSPKEVFKNLDSGNDSGK
jgi:hypothetical protein